MRVVARLASFVALLAAVFGLAFLVGGMSDVDVDTDDDHGHDPVSARGHGSHGAAGGYALALDTGHVRAGQSQIGFQVVDDRGEAVTAYDERHERDLHLIVVAADNLSDYQHVHPRLSPDGTWLSDLRLAPGRYRLFADTQPTGAGEQVLEADLRVVGGRPVRAPLPEPSRVASIGEYAVSLAVDGSDVTFTVTRGGEPVTDLEPYLGAFGHLVAIRADDLDYLHAHPEEGVAGPDVRFEVEFGEAGQHALYFEFKHDGVVRTAQFTLGSSGTDHGPGSGSGSGAQGSGSGHDH